MHTPNLTGFCDKQSFCSDFKSAVKDYSKVIELKPDLKEAYEKRADATGMIINSISYKPFEKEKFYQVISDYEKAIEFKRANKGENKKIG